MNSILIIVLPNEYVLQYPMPYMFYFNIFEYKYIRSMRHYSTFIALVLLSIPTFSQVDMYSFYERYQNGPKVKESASIDYRVDSAGNLIEESNSRYEYTYDDKGRMTECTGYLVPEQTITWKYTYNDSWYPVEYYQNGDLMASYRYEDNDSIIRQFKSDTLLISISFLNNLKQIVETKQANSFSPEPYLFTYAYDEKGRLSVMDVSLGGNSISTYQYFYDDKDNIIETMRYSATMKSKVVFSYEPDGRLREICNYDGEGKLLSKSVFTIYIPYR
ncbi:MAG: hypothetical protein JXB49_25890 [Bacteroidales bacterium]|nr:hypothetical protein [Bacteroidales bacterium]